MRPPPAATCNTPESKTGVLVVVGVAVGVKVGVAVKVGVDVGGTGVGDCITGCPSDGVGATSALPVKSPLRDAEIIIFFLSFFFIAAALSPKLLPLAPAVRASSSKV